MADSKELYLDLLKKCLTYYIWRGDFEPITPSDIPFGWKKPIIKILSSILPKDNIQIVKKINFDPEKRAEGLDWPFMADTMIGIKRLDNLQFCIEDIIANNVPGDLIETGVWRGGACIFMRAVLKTHGVTDRTVWLADSFQGLPEPDNEKYPQDKGDIHHQFSYLAVSCEDVQNNFAKYGLLDDQVKFLRGWFKDTLSIAPIEKLAVLRLDGDMYESTMDALGSLYSKLSVGGYVIIDDYALDPCRQAVTDFRKANGIKDEIIKIDSIGVYWQRK